MNNPTKFIQLFLEMYKTEGVDTTLTHDTSIDGFIRGEFHTPSHGVHYTKYFPEDVYLAILILGMATFMQQPPEDILFNLSSELTYGLPFSKLFNMMEFVYSAYAAPNSTVDVTEEQLRDIASTLAPSFDLHTPFTPTMG